MRGAISYRMNSGCAGRAIDTAESGPLLKTAADQLVTQMPATRSRSPPTGFLGIRGIHRHFRNEAMPVRHFDLRETLSVKDVVLLDDAVPIEQKRDDRIDLVVGERSRIAGRHRAVDIVPHD